jgi:hypothetical protein
MACACAMRDVPKAAARLPDRVSCPDEAQGWRKVPMQLDFARRGEAILARNLGAP